MSVSRTSPQLTLRYEDLEALQEDLECNLRHGRAFAGGAGGVAERQACEVAIVHPESGDTFDLQAEVVWVKDDEPGRGIGLAFQEFDPDCLERLAAFAQGSKSERGPEHIHLRVRRYSTAEQMKGAREGDLAERIALERVYGKGVWELLLQNRRITVPEVTRIARKGNVPAPLLDTVAANAAWLSSGELRRVLLTNARLGNVSRDKILRALPKAELTLVTRQPAYPPAVRQAAKKLQGR